MDRAFQPGSWPIYFNRSSLPKANKAQVWAYGLPVKSCKSTGPGSGSAAVLAIPSMEHASKFRFQRRKNRRLRLFLSGFFLGVVASLPGAGMSTVINFRDMLERKLSVFLSGGKPLMAQQLLNGAQVGAFHKHVGAKGMA